MKRAKQVKPKKVFANFGEYCPHVHSVIVKFEVTGMLWREWIWIL